MKNYFAYFLIIMGVIFLLASGDDPFVWYHMAISAIIFAGGIILALPK